jgi:hypothetical protein
MATNPELDSKLIEQPNELAVELNVNELNVVLAALQELPHRVADPVLRKIMQQAQGQLQG